MKRGWLFPFLYPFAIGLLTWFGLFGQPNPTQLVVGVAVCISGAFLANRLARKHSSLPASERPKAVWFLAAYLGGRALPAMVRHSFSVAAASVFRPSRMEGAIIAVELPDASQEALALISYGITLSPDRQVVSIDEENSIVYVHVQTPPDPEEARQEILRDYAERVRKATPC